MIGQPNPVPERRVKPVTAIAELVGSAEGIGARLWMLVAAAALALGAAIVVPDPAVRLGAQLAGMTLLAMAGLIALMMRIHRARSDRALGVLELVVGQDATPCFTTDEQGVIGFRNAAARARFESVPGGTLVAALQDHFASPGSVLFRLQSRAAAGGLAREDVVTRRGHVRLSAHRMTTGQFLWRLEEFQDRSQSRGAETLSLPMLVANRAGVVLFCNEAMRRLVGRRPRHLDRLFTDPHPGAGEAVEVATDEGPVRAFLAEVQGPGERRELYFMPVPDRRPDTPTLTDFEHVPVALMKFAPDGKLDAANRAAREMLALAADDRPGFGDLFEGLGRSIQAWLADVASGRGPAKSEVLRVSRGPEDAFVQILLRQIVEQGRVRVLAVLTDATALKTLEAQFTQSQKMQAIGLLAGGIAHDFNNLLTAISGHCDLLLLRHDALDPDYADLVQIRQNANRAAALVGQLLAFSRKQKLTPERIELQDLLSDLAHLLNRLVGENVTLRVAHAPDLGTIRADRRQLEQVIMNLVVNARDAMPQGGVIRIETEALTLEDDLPRERAVIPRGDYAVVRVLDTGQGIPPDRIPKIFEPFYTTKRPGEGTGLGLSTVYGIVKQSGGFVFVDSEVGLGTVFHLYFPINEEADAPVLDPPPPMTRPLGRQGEGVVLLVEDEAPVRAFASRALRLRGYTVIEAESAEDALETLRDPAIDVDIFVTDVVMPGMDGPSWVRQALEQRPDVRVVFVSGYTEESLWDRQDRIPNAVFLPKPFSLGELTAVVQGQLH